MSQVCKSRHASSVRMTYMYMNMYVCTYIYIYNLYMYICILCMECDSSVGVCLCVFVCVRVCVCVCVSVRVCVSVWLSLYWIQCESFVDHDSVNAQLQFYARIYTHWRFPSFWDAIFLKCILGPCHFYLYSYFHFQGCEATLHEMERESFDTAKKNQVQVR